MKEEEFLSSRRKMIQITSVVLLCLGVFVISFYLELSLTTKTKTEANQSGMKTKRTQSCDTTIDIVVQFINGRNNEKLQRNFRNFLISLLSRTKCKISLYIVTDSKSKESMRKILDKVTSDSKLPLAKLTYIDSADITQKLPFLSKAVDALFINKGNSYYNKWFFYTSLIMHRLLPSNISKIIMLDIDMQFRSDVHQLYAYFDVMNDSQIIGLAREQQPVYAHVNWLYRENHIETLIGAPPPNGLTGFNSGTKLMNFRAMRDSVVYNNYLDDTEYLHALVNKYNFNGHLGDQDFYTLLSYEHMDLFYTLPCQWNRQLCQWWKNDGYKRIFDSYFNCTPPYHILHGNCDSPIPDPI